jgi:hypothetical protein
MDEIWGKYKKKDWTKGMTDFFTMTTTCILLETTRVATRILLDLFEAIGKKRFKVPQGWP